jgi:hypothetical protein
MSTTRERKAAYSSVIQDLYAKRAQLDQAIEALEALLQADGAPQRAAADVTALSPSEDRARRAARAEADEAGGPLISAIRSVLRRSDRPLGNSEIFKQLEAAGVKFRSANPQFSVSQVLSRNSRLFGEPVRVGRGLWALR